MIMRDGSDRLRCIISQEWMSDPAEARLYTESQHSGSIGPAITLARKEQERLSNCKNLLDIGGGSGGFSITLAGKFPELSCVVMDFPEVKITHLH